MKIVEREKRFSDSFRMVVVAQVFQYGDSPFMRTDSVKDSDADFLAEYNAVRLTDGHMTWFDDDDPVEILDDARLILS